MLLLQADYRDHLGNPNCQVCKKQRLWFGAAQYEISLILLRAKLRIRQNRLFDKHLWFLFANKHC